MFFTNHPNWKDFCTLYLELERLCDYRRIPNDIGKEFITRANSIKSYATNNPETIPDAINKLNALLDEYYTYLEDLRNKLNIPIMFISINYFNKLVKTYGIWFCVNSNLDNGIRKCQDLLRDLPDNVSDELESQRRSIKIIRYTIEDYNNSISKLYELHAQITTALDNRTPEFIEMIEIKKKLRVESEKVATIYRGIAVDCVTCFGRKHALSRYVVKMCYHEIPNVESFDELTRYSENIENVRKQINDAINEKFQKPSIITEDTYIYHLDGVTHGVEWTLMDNNIWKIKDLITHTEKEILSFKRIGPKKFEKIKTELNELGFSFKS